MAGAEPQVPAAILENGHHRLVGETVLGGEILPGFTVVTADSIKPGTEPHPPVPIFSYRRHPIVPQAVRCAKGRKFRAIVAEGAV